MCVCKCGCVYVCVWERLKGSLCLNFISLNLALTLLLTLTHTHSCWCRIDCIIWLKGCVRPRSSIFIGGLCASVHTYVYLCSMQGKFLGFGRIWLCVFSSQVICFLIDSWLVMERPYIEKVGSIDSSGGL